MKNHSLRRSLAVAAISASALVVSACSSTNAANYGVSDPAVGVFVVNDRSEQFRVSSVVARRGTAPPQGQTSGISDGSRVVVSLPPGDYDVAVTYTGGDGLYQVSPKAIEEKVTIQPGRAVVYTLSGGQTPVKKWDGAGNVFQYEPPKLMADAPLESNLRLGLGVVLVAGLALGLGKILGAGEATRR